MTVGSSAAAAAAAAEEQRRIEEEEEIMTRYSDVELSEGWEFKIVRSNTGAFRKPDVLRRLVEEEARAGWVLLEKFDDARVRFKRPVSAREGDAARLSSGIDPYRTTFGMPQGLVAVLTLLVIFGIAGLVLALIFALTGAFSG